MPRGHIAYWNIERGFGRITNDGDRDARGIFIHITQVNEAPQVGSEFAYDIGEDREGRTCAINVRAISAAREEADRVFGNDA